MRVPFSGEVTRNHDRGSRATPGRRRGQGSGVLPRVQVLASILGRRRGHRQVRASTTALVADLPGLRPTIRPREVSMLLQHFGLGVVRRPAAPGYHGANIDPSSVLRKVSSQPGSIRPLPGRCVALRSVRGSRVRDTPRQGAPSRSTVDGGVAGSLASRLGPRVRSL
jgi:hypothetical protein